MVALAMASVLSACSNQQLTDANRLRRIMAATARQPRRFVYDEATSAAKISVKGVIEDDFRYKSAVSINGKLAMEEVVKDDTLADRFVLGSAVGIFVRKAQTDAPGVVTAADTSAPTNLTEASPEVVNAVTNHQWVMDPVGAPSLLPSASEKHPLGSDPIYDSLTVFRYVEQAIREAFRVRRFNPDDLDYKPAEDPFPKPAQDSDVTRYDLERLRLPRPQDVAGSAANQVIPGARHFRKMAVYVRDGLVIRVLEQIDVASRLKDLERNYDVKIPASLPLAQRIAVAIDSINAVRRGQGIDPIRVRTMSLQFVDLGRRNTVGLPTAAVEGSLAAFQNRGRRLPQGTPAAAPG
jgi:hypothetical protein